MVIIMIDQLQAGRNELKVTLCYRGECRYDLLLLAVQKEERSLGQPIVEQYHLTLVPVLSKEREILKVKTEEWVWRRKINSLGERLASYPRSLAVFSGHSLNAAAE